MHKKVDGDFILHSVYKERKQKTWSYVIPVRKRFVKKNMEITRQGNLITIRCKEYEKDNSKICGYKKPLLRTARQCDTLMKLNI